MAKKRRKPVVKKITLKKGHIAKVVIPKGHEPVVIHAGGSVEIVPKPKALKSWWSRFLDGI